MKASLPIALLFAALPAFAQDLAALTAETKKAVLPVVPKVVGAMQDAVAEKGVAGAIPVCKEQAPALIQAKRQETGWDIRRVSLKTRNAERGTPDLWEARQLADFNIRAGNGEKRKLSARPGHGLQQRSGTRCADRQATIVSSLAGLVVERRMRAIVITT